MQTSNERLEREIEKLVRDHLAACRRAATAAVERAFTAAMSPPAPMPKRAKKPPRAPRPRRTPEELAILTDQLHDAVHATPGETMTVLAAQLGMKPRSLQIPATRLKRAGHVRTVGQRQYMRYFPVAKTEPVSRTPLLAVSRGA